MMCLLFIHPVIASIVCREGKSDDKGLFYMVFIIIFLINSIGATIVFTANIYKDMDPKMRKFGFILFFSFATATLTSSLITVIGYFV